MATHPLPAERAAKAYRPRHDGFTPARQRTFFKVLKKSGCITDACRACGISRNTVRRWRDRWTEFDEKVEAALAIASVELDMIAWKRATQGAEEKVYRDGRLVFTRVKPSDSMLRLLMQGANPGKYGRMGQTPKRALVKKLRKRPSRRCAPNIAPRGARRNWSPSSAPCSKGSGGGWKRRSSPRATRGGRGAADTAGLAGRARSAGAAAAARRSGAD